MSQPTQSTQGIEPAKTTTDIQLEIDMLEADRQTLSAIIQEKKDTLYSMQCTNEQRRFMQSYQFPGWQYVKKCDITSASTGVVASQFEGMDADLISRLPVEALMFLVAQLDHVPSPGSMYMNIPMVPRIYKGPDGMPQEKSMKHFLRDHVLHLCDYGCNICGIVSHTYTHCPNSKGEVLLPYIPPVGSVNKTHAHAYVPRGDRTKSETGRTAKPAQTKQSTDSAPRGKNTRDTRDTKPKTPVSHQPLKTDTPVGYTPITKTQGKRVRRQPKKETTPPASH